MNINHIISLGSDCLPRIALTKEGLKKTKKEGELSCPFDLCVSNIHDVLDVLKNNFKDFTTPNFLYFTEIDKCKVLTNKKYTRIFFNHESPFLTELDFAKDNFKLFVERYNSRIENFKKYINDNNILFVLHCRDDVDLNETYNTLKSIYPKLNFILCGVCLYEAINVNYKNNNPNILYLFYPMEHIWNCDEDTNDFVNKLVCKFLKFKLKNNLNLPTV